MIYCSVNGCYSNNKYGTKRIFFEFPVKQHERAKMWLTFCCDVTARPFHVQSYICDLHFVDSDFESADRKSLKLTAVPSIKAPSKKVQPSVVSPSKARPNTSRNEPQDDNLINEFEANLSNCEAENVDNSETGPHIECVDSISPNDLNDDSLDKTQIEKKPKSANEKPHQVFQKRLQALQKSRPAILKRYQPIEPKSVTNIVDQNYKTFKKVQKGFELALHRRAETSTDEEFTDHNKTTSHKGSPEITRQNCKSSSLKPLQGFKIKVKSTVESDEESETHVDDDVYILPHILSSDADMFAVDGTNTDNFMSSPPALDYELNEEGSQSIPTISVSRSRLNPLEKQLNKINEFRKQRLVKKYEKSTSKRKTLGVSVNSTDPRYSIAATAQSLGTVNTPVPEPVEIVNLEAGEWSKLYTPSSISFPKVYESYVGPMVNQLRARLPTLNDRDRLEVSFLLSMMSVYPGSPKHIQELLLQRLKLVYIATMFKWDTALALASKDENSLATSSSPEKNVLRNTTSHDCGEIVDTLNPNTESPCVDSNNSPVKAAVSKSYSVKHSKKKNENLIKPPRFAFEIIIQEKMPKTPEGERSGTTHGF